ncbi:hypothetical protein [Xenorhabdus littoralis]|uniref:hypothetical protein n=1 Tax=Xenorhabdus littoralis TaxID=2582835 RepID=UPI0029E7F3D8|nr:hypothetical protein [Xenorhabdus sp. psl]MDX7993237.1 hypothetical protein [Xenorhabdus sp. psl]
MEKQFLAICSPLNIDQQRKVATSVALLSNWKEQQNHSATSLLIEALNQFAVRYASSQFSVEEEHSFLPVMIERFSCNGVSYSDKIFIEGELEPMYNTFRVNCRAYNEDFKEKFVAQASIIVQAVELPIIPFPDVITEKSADFLWEVWPINQECYGFHLNLGHYLFQEHFPGRPVCPGSLLIDLALSLCKWNRSNIIKLHKVKFLKSVTPDRNYIISLNINSEETLGRFSINSENGERHTNGSFSFSQVLL